jgi:two-component system phosphate regulon sensor histidine kinase PhoR
MILIDLKLALLTLFMALCAGAIWRITRRDSHVTVQADRKFWAICESLPFGLAILDSTGAIIVSNDQAMDWLHMLSNTAQTKAVQLPPALSAALNQPTATTGVIAHPIALRWWHNRIDHNNAILLLFDQSEQQQLSNQHQAFIGQLSHELRTPLTSLIAHLDIARNSATSAALRAASLDSLHQETHRLARLVRDLLELHRLETTADFLLQPTDIVLLAEAVIAQMFPRIEERGFNLALESSASTPLIMGHADRLRQVFQNVLDNAIKYCRPGDTINIAFKLVPEGVQCAISDSGPGIPAADLQNVAKPLYRGRSDVAGNGIGLALVDEILRRHHSWLQITSTTDANNSGTTCSWILPIAVDQVRA